MSPTVSINRLSCLSPLPDQRRDSSGEDFFFNLPVPKQFADNGSRRSSGVPERILEQEENSVSLDKDPPPKTNTLLVPEIVERCTLEQRPPFLPKFEDNERQQLLHETHYPHVVIESNVLIGDTINIIDTDQPVSTRNQYNEALEEHIYT